jgi:hypothetical protein
MTPGISQPTSSHSASSGSMLHMGYSCAGGFGGGERNEENVFSDLTTQE